MPGTDIEEKRTFIRVPASPLGREGDGGGKGGRKLVTWEKSRSY